MCLEDKLPLLPPRIQRDESELIARNLCEFIFKLAASRSNRSSKRSQEAMVRLLFHLNSLDEAEFDESFDE